MREPDAWEPYDDTERVLKALSERHVKIGIVSDFAWDLRVHLDHYGLGDLVDTVVLSCEMAREKPDPAMFLTACRQLAANPRATLMVGDNPTRDGGAAACGLRTYLLPGGRHRTDRGLDHALGFLS